MENKFEAWLSKINEDLDNVPQVSAAGDAATAEVAPTPSADVRRELSQQCDDILNSLETLAGELTEEFAVNENELAYLGAGAAAVAAGLGIAAKKLLDIAVAAPMARKKQKKVNAMSMKIAGVEAGLSKAPKDKKDAVEAKLAKAREQRDELQKVVDDRYSSAPKSVQNALSSEKAKGKLEAYAVIMGTASEDRQTEIKDQIAKLKERIKEDEQAFKEEAEEARNAEISSEEQEQIAAAQNGEKTEDGEKTKDGEEEAEDSEEEAEDAPVKNSKEDKLSRVDALIKKAEETGNDSLLQKAKALKDKISAKESWQVTNTELGRLFEMEISRLERHLA